VKLNIFTMLIMMLASSCNNSTCGPECSVPEESSENPAQNTTGSSPSGGSGSSGSGDNLAPKLSFLSISPAASGSDLNPTIKGVTSEPSDVTLYLDSQCSTPKSATHLSTIFSATGIQLTATVTPNSQTQVFAKAVDATGNASACKALVIYSHTSSVPQVTSVSSTSSNGNYPAGSSISIAVTFSETIIVNGLPKLEIQTLAGTQLATYVSGSSSNTLAFYYTVGSSDNASDLDYASTGALILNGGTIMDVDGNAATLTLPPGGGYSSLAGQKNIALDTIIPTLIYVSLSPSSPSISRTPAVTLLASEDADVTLYSDVSCSAAISAATNLLKDAPVALSAYSLTANGATTIYGRAIDNVGNSSSCTSLITYTHDTAAPAASSFVRSPGQPAMTHSLPFSFTVTFNETINASSFTAADISNIGSATGVNWQVTDSGDGSTFTVTATSTAAGTIIPRIAAGSIVDVAGNANAASISASQSVNYFDGAFGVQVNQATAQADPTNSLPVNFTVVFTSAVNQASFTTADIIQNGTAAGVTWSLDTVDNITWTMRATSIAFSGTVIPSLAANTVMDTFGNGNIASVATDNMVTFDAVAPVLAFSSISASNPGSSLTPTIFGTASEPSTVTLYYDSACSTPRSSSVSNTVFASPGITVTSNVATNNSTTIYGRAIDTVGNTSSCTSLVTYTHHSSPAFVTNVTASIANGSYGVSQIIPIQVSFSKVVTVTGVPRLTLQTGGGGQNAVVNYTSGSGTTTLTFNYSVWTGDQSSDLDYASTSALHLNSGTIRDGVGNIATLTLPPLGSAASISGQKAIVIDTSSPVLVFASITPASPNSSRNPVVGITLSETVTALRLYSDAGCTTAISTGLSAPLGTAYITTSTLPTDATTYIYASAADWSGNVSSCYYMTTYANNL